MAALQTARTMHGIKFKDICPLLPSTRQRATCTRFTPTTTVPFAVPTC